MLLSCPERYNHQYLRRISDFKDGINMSQEQAALYLYCQQQAAARNYWLMLQALNATPSLASVTAASTVPSLTFSSPFLPTSLSAQNIADLSTVYSQQQQQQQQEQQRQQQLGQQQQQQQQEQEQQQQQRESVLAGATCLPTANIQNPTMKEQQIAAFEQLARLGIPLQLNPLGILALQQRDSNEIKCDKLHNTIISSKKCAEKAAESILDLKQKVWDTDACTPKTEPSITSSKISALCSSEEIPSPSSRKCNFFLRFFLVSISIICMV